MLDNDEDGPWCYTINPNVRYEYCAQIPKFSNQNFDLKRKNDFQK